MSSEMTAVGRLGIMGGSFDPPHVAHLIMAETGREALQLDLVLFMPVAQQPLKLDRPATPAKHRLAMTRLAITANPHFALSTVDVDRPGPSYTVDSLRIIREQFGPEGAAWFLMGADSLQTFPTWRDPLGILALCRLAVVRRPGVAVDLKQIEQQLPGIRERIDWVDAPLIDISATDIRARVSQGLSIRYRVTEPVRNYIESQSLYK